MIKPDLNRKISELIAQNEALKKLTANSGLAISMLKKDEIIFEGTYGFRDLARRLPVTRDTIFETGSLTKAFTSTALLMAAEEGRVNLSQPINSQKRILVLNDENVTRSISLIEVLSHTTGMAGNDMLWYLADEKPVDLVRSIKSLALIPDAFRKVFNYNSLMYSAVGHQFNEIVGKTWESYVTEKILKPLKMNSTSFQPSPDEKDVALPYTAGEPVKRISTANVAASAAIRSSLSDLSRWVAFHLNGFKNADGKQILGLASVDQMFSPHVKIENANPMIFQGLEWLGPSFDYGLGWFIGSVNGKKALFHMGIIDGFSTAIVIVPSMQLGCVALMNANLSAVPGLLIQEMLNHAL